MSQPRATYLATFLLAALLALAGFAAPAGAEVEVSVALAGDTDAPAEVTIIALPAGLGGIADAGDAVEFEVGLGSWALDLPTERGWRLRARSTGFWGNAEVVEAGATGEVELRLWRSGVLRGELTTVSSRGLPAEVELGFEGDPFWQEADELPSATEVCPVVNDVWRCEVPAGALSITLSAGHFIPQRRSEVTVEPDQAVDLGVFELQLGGSILGRVEREDGGVPSRECEVRLKGNRAVPAAPVADDGTFILAGVLPREYVVIASEPDWLDASSEPVAVLPGEYSELLEPLVLRRPATLELLFTPPVGAEDQGWRFLLARLDPEAGGSGRRLSGQADVNGAWTGEGLEPGRYEISVMSDRRSKLFSETLDVQSGRTSIPIELPLLLVDGWIGAGDEPLAARVTLIRPEDNQRATFESGEDGRFTGVLPGEGVWQVRVQAPAEGINTGLDAVEVWAQGSSGLAVVELRLPGTTLEGEVTDLLGNPLEGASVMVQRRGIEQGAHRATTDAQGRFRIRGLAPGPVSVMASAGRQRSNWFQLVLEEGRPVPPLQLVVR